MKRIVSVIAVAALMVAMMLAMAVPAFAAPGGNGGGATVDRIDPCVVHQGAPAGTCQSVITPSGNLNVSGHAHHA